MPISFPCIKVTEALVLNDNEDTSVDGSISGSICLWGFADPITKMCSRLVNSSVCELEHNEKDMNSPLGTRAQKFV